MEDQIKKLADFDIRVMEFHQLRLASLADALDLGGMLEVVADFLNQLGGIGPHVQILAGLEKQLEAGRRCELIREQKSSR